MNVGTACSVIVSDPETSAPLPEAVWYQEKALSSSQVDDSSGFFVSLLQRWDIASDTVVSKSVFYQISPFSHVFENQQQLSRQDSKHGQPKSSGDGTTTQSPLFCLRLPRQLSVCDEITQGDEDKHHAERTETFPEPTLSSANNSPRLHQSRRVPLLARFSDNQKLLAMQFSPTHVRIAVPDNIDPSDRDRVQQKPKASIKHWTLELLSTAKDPYAPVASASDAMPKIRLATNQPSTETILPGGIFWLDQSYSARGSEYIEALFVVTTTKSLLVYKVTLNYLRKEKPTLTVVLAHVFSHPHASAAWWSPKSLVLIVGSYQETKHTTSINADSQKHQISDAPHCSSNHHNPLLLHLRAYFFSGDGPFTSHREVLRNPLLLPLRLERPPPVRFPAFPVGRSLVHSMDTFSDSTICHDPTDGSMSSSPSSKRKLHKSHVDKQTPPTCCISVVHLYGKAFVVEVGAQTTVTTAGNHDMDIVLHELDQENFSVDVGRIRLPVILPKNVRSAKEDILITVLDDVLCVSFRRSKFHLFLDIQDAGSECCYVVEKYSTETDEAHLQSSTPALYISPSYLFIPRKGIILPLSLDLERLAPSVSKHHRCNFSMLLRRQQKQSREIAISHFSAIGALSTIEQRLKWINLVAHEYAKCESVACVWTRDNIKEYGSSQITPYEWDMRSTLDLIFVCALLPKGAEFLHWSDYFDDKATVDSLPSLPELASSSSIIFQEDLLRRLFLPKTTKVLLENQKTGKTEENQLVIRRIAEVAVSYLGILEQKGGKPCHALSCFVFAILWRLGDFEILQAIMKSGSLFPCYREKEQKAPHKTIAYIGTKWQASLLIAIVNEVEFGSLNMDGATSFRNPDFISPLRHRTLQISRAILSTRNDYRFPAALITQLLCRRHLLDAMSACVELVDAPDMSYKNVAKYRPSPSLVYAMRLHRGEDFVDVAMERLNQIKQSKLSEACAQLQSLYSFLSMWDPQCLQHICLGHRRSTRDDLELFSSRLLKKRISRRPSWVCMSVIEKGEKGSQGLHTLQTREIHLSMLFHHENEKIYSHFGELCRRQPRKHIFHNKNR